MIFQNVNVLLLDEASNNLDIPTLTILEDYLNSFVGIVVTVSHDRYFLDNVADWILAFEEEGKIRQYEGGYTDYLEALKKRTSQASTGVQNSGKAAAGTEPFSYPMENQAQEKYRGRIAKSDGKPATVMCFYN